MDEYIFNPNELLVSSLGLTDYETSWAIQQSLCDSRQNQLISDCLILNQHPHTYTIGKRGSINDLLLTKEDLVDSGISVYQVDRGGGTTYHGPGQIVAYPIMDTRFYGGAATYVNKIEDSILLTLSEFGLIGKRLKGFPGVWIDDYKIASIGLRIRRGITTHGFSINVNNDLSYFHDIVACGVTKPKVTSIEHATKQVCHINQVTPVLIRSLCYTFQKYLTKAPNQYFLTPDRIKTTKSLECII